MNIIALVVSAIVFISATNGNVVPELNAESRIVGGDFANLVQFTFMALLVIDKSVEKWVLCAGSVISDKFVLTAASCTSRLEKYQLNFNKTLINSYLYRTTSISVYLGDPGFKKGLRFDIEKDKVINHENFNPTTLENDISLIQIPVINLNGKHFELS